MATSTSTITPPSITPSRTPPATRLYKGILEGHSSAVFNGKILVRKDAQKTDAKQTNKNLVLSEDAVINTKPELQILADDVRCTHGATIGQLDPEGNLLPAVARHRPRGCPQSADLRLRARHRRPHQGRIAARAVGETVVGETPWEPQLSAALGQPGARREHFPVLDQRVHGKPLVYLDNAATTQKPQMVLDAMNQFYQTG